MDDITESTKIISQAKKDLEKYKKSTYSDEQLAETEHRGNNLKTMYDNARKLMDYVKSALNSAKSYAGTSSGNNGDDSNPSEFGGDGKTLEETVKDADNFLEEGNSGVLNQTKMQGTSNIIYNTLLVIGTIAAVIIGFVIAIQFMMGSVEEKAEVKKVLITYIIGCVILFGAFIIWKVVLTIANTTLT